MAAAEPCLLRIPSTSLFRPAATEAQPEDAGRGPPAAGVEAPTGADDAGGSDGAAAAAPGAGPRRTSNGLQAIMAQLSLQGGTDPKIAGAAAGKAPMGAPERPAKGAIGSAGNGDGASGEAAAQQQQQQPPPPGAEPAPRWAHVRALAYDEAAVPDRTMAVCALASAALVQV